MVIDIYSTIQRTATAAFLLLHILQRPSSRYFPTVQGLALGCYALPQQWYHTPEAHWGVCWLPSNLETWLQWSQAGSGEGSSKEQRTGPRSSIGSREKIKDTAWVTEQRRTGPCSSIGSREKIKDIAWVTEQWRTGPCSSVRLREKDERDWLGNFQSTTTIKIYFIFNCHLLYANSKKRNCSLKGLTSLVRSSRPTYSAPTINDLSFLILCCISIFLHLEFNELTSPSQSFGLTNVMQSNHFQQNGYAHHIYCLLKALQMKGKCTVWTTALLCLR